MKGDIILVGEEHKNAAEEIIARLIDDISATDRRYTKTFAGE